MANAAEFLQKHCHSLSIDWSIPTIKKALVRVLTLILGVATGEIYSRAYSYFPAQNQSSHGVSLEESFKFSKTSIEIKSDACGGGKKTVTTVLGNIFESNTNNARNARNARNAVSLHCFDNQCGLIVSDCKPWQSQECGSRTLRFNTNNRHKIIPTSFVCTDMPQTSPT